MRLKHAFLLVVLAAAPAWGHGGTTPPPPAEPPPPPPPNPKNPNHPPKWKEPDGPPPPPPETPPPDPNPPAPQPQPPEPRKIRPTVRPPGVTGRRGSVGEDAWRVYWEYNREYLLELRKTIRERIVLTGEGPVRPDVLGKHRDEVLATLRDLAGTENERTVRASALIALGRVGGEEDARRFVETLARESEPTDVREAAAVGLGILAPIGSEDVAARVRAYLDYVLQNPTAIGGRARGLTICAIGLRARSDAKLRMDLLGRLAVPALPDGEEATHVIFACGLAGDPAAVPELLRAAKKAEIAGAQLTDIERAHAVTALGRAAGAAAIDDLVALLRSRRSGLETKRASALALGRLLRDAPAPEDAAADRAGRALRDCFEGENDTLLRGFAAMALGGARPPRSLPILMEAIDHGGNASVKPYCALALGLGARTLGGDEARRIGNFLRDELGKAAHMDLGSALSLGLGLAQATAGEKDLLDRVGMERLPAQVRGTAAQGIGLLGTASPAAVEALNEAARTGKRGVLEDAALALGLLGQRAIAKDLALDLPSAGSAEAQSRLMLALIYLAHSESVEPLLALLRDKAAAPTAREFAAAALGILGDLRDEDALFALDAWFNLYATTRATNELVRLY